MGSANEGESAGECKDNLDDPEVVPRVGDEYQAEIPSLCTAPYLSQLVKTRDSEITVIEQESTSLGLPIPLKWAHCKFKGSSGFGTLESVSSRVGLVISEHECRDVNVELHTASYGEVENIGGFSNFESSSKSDQKDQPIGKYLLPGLLDDQSWTDIEYKSFLLGLYVFGKKLNILKRFIGSKNMGDILSFYYGEFYKSKDYCRWSECRKLRTKRCIYGQKIFTGWRQQELLSRLFSHLPKECQTTLAEISKNFGVGKMPFEEYVFALKDAVGIDLLIDAVGIGKGKQDLTGTAVEPTKTNHVFSVRSEMPIGKACSSLTPADIIKFLTGDFRLSKARSSDLFWEAVWPRLLAKGWHSEQPKDQVVSGSKQSLVFLVPGVKKFSRRKLVKGSHYFDSISDVLNKVASEPGLLETESQATEGNVDMEKRQEKQDLEGVSNRQQFHHLQSHSSKCNQDLTKFTIVDTSLVHDMNQRKVRQRRSLPFQTMGISTISSCSSESEQDTSEDSEDQVEQTNASSRIEDQVKQANSSYLIEDQLEQANTSSPVKDQVEQANSSYPIEDKVEQANSSNPVEEFPDRGLSICSPDCAHVPEVLNTTEIKNGCPSDMHNDEHSREIDKHPLIQKTTSDCTIPCITEMQKLRACNHGEFSHCTESTSVDRKFDLNEPISPSNLLEVSDGMDLQNLSFSSYLPKGTPNMSNEGSVIENHLVGVVSAGNSERRMLIDLNFPQLSPELELEMQIPSTVGMAQNDEQCANTLSSSEISQFNETQEFPDGNKEQQCILVNRRQSTRNRPLTTKALEALEYRFINSKRKRKNTESSDNNSRSKCGRVSSGTIVSGTCDNGIENSMADTEAEEENIIQAYSCSINLNRGSL